MGAPDFPQIQDRNARANLCKNNIYPATIKTDNEAVAMRNVFVQQKRNQQLHKFKKRQHS